MRSNTWKFVGRSLPSRHEKLAEIHFEVYPGLRYEKKFRRYKEEWT